MPTPKILDVISIDGNIGCGKSSALAALARALDLDQAAIANSIFPEPLHKWRLLDDFYRDQKRFACAFNLEVLESYCDARPGSIVERSPLACKNVFVQMAKEAGDLSEAEHGLVSRIFDRIGWTPQLTVYLRSDPDLCHRRAEERSRECESNVPLEYFRSVHAMYERSMQEQESARPGCVVIVKVTESKTPEDIAQEIVRACALTRNQFCKCD